MKAAASVSKTPLFSTSKVLKNPDEATYMSDTFAQ